MKFKTLLFRIVIAAVFLIISINKLTAIEPVNPEATPEARALLKL